MSDASVDSEGTGADSEGAAADPEGAESSGTEDLIGSVGEGADAEDPDAPARVEADPDCPPGVDTREPGGVAGAVGVDAGEAASLPAPTGT